MNALSPRLDRSRRAPDTAEVTEPAPPSHDEGPLVARAKAVAKAVAKLKGDIARGEAAVRDARAEAHDAYVREAVTRAELTLALTHALLGRAEAKALARQHAAARYFQARPFAFRRRSRRVDAWLSRLTTFGKAAVIARSGVWRGSGRPLHDLRHMAAYARRGPNPEVRPPAPFDQAWYLTRYPDVAASGASPLVHYLTAGAAEGRAPHPLFDPVFYARENAQEIGASGASPLEHFVAAGASRGRNPHPLFDMAHYASQAPDLAPGEHMIEHYLRAGWRQGLSPHPLFDPDWYRRQMPRAEQETPPLLHYLSQGWKAGLKPHPLFDPDWYGRANPDIASRGLEPLSHFVTAGAAEGRSPSPWFDLPHYVAVRGEGLPAGRNPLVDYLEVGAWLVTEPRPGFPTPAYLAAHPELAREGVTPLEHWARRNSR